jgi:hypothetical protein
MNTEKIYSRIDEKLLERLKIAAAKQKVNQPTAIAEAIEQWVTSVEKSGHDLSDSRDQEILSSVVSSNQPVPIPEEPAKKNPKDMVNLTVTRGERTWVHRFLTILRSGTVAARGIKWNIVMVMKGMGLPYDAEDHPLPESAEQDRDARSEIAIIERLVAGPEVTEPAPGEGGRSHPPRRKRDRGA